MKKKLLARALRYLVFVNVIVTFLCASAAQAASYRPGSKAGEHFGTSKLSNSTVKAPVKVTGKVTDEKGLPLIGVNITERGARNNAVSDNKGTYTITVSSENAVLVFSYIGFSTKNEPVRGRNVVDVVLQIKDSALNEVVVTALGIKKESKKLGYATTSVNIDEIAQNRTTNVMTSLEGKVAGLDIAPPTAGAGASNRIRLRGQSGFNGQTNSPLIVVDGLPMDQGTRSAEGGGGTNGALGATDQGDNLSQINQDDIESITVLKGATAAALYGSRAASGAIIITTKSGAKNSKFGIEFTSSYAAQQALDFTNYQTVYGTGIGGLRPTTQAEAQSMGNLSWGAKYDGVPTVQYDGVLRPYAPDKNRITEFYNTGTSLTNTIALSGGNSSTSFRASFSNQDVNGISPGNTYHRKIFNIGLNSKITPKLTFQTNINYTHENNNNPPLVGAQGVGFSSFLNRTPLTLAI
ncbi:MAG: TonB-dependent receptor plug domain-containing protein, partial [Mucilaginibacter sp.]